MKKDLPTLQRVTGRGSDDQTTGRFEKLKVELDLSDYGWLDLKDIPTLKTEFYKDFSKTIVNENNSPDIPFRYSINPYRGCEHGCAYCYARPTHEYLGMSADLDFESKVFVKENAAQLLREKLMSKSWRPETISISGVTDCYQPAERRFKITRQCLEVLAEFRNPVGIVTKNQLITRDLDVLREMAKDDTAAAFISVTTLNAELARSLEPRTSSPRARLQAIEALSKAGVPVGVNVAPVIPGLTDHEIPAILKACSEVGAKWAGYVLLRLPYSVKDIFSRWIEREYPEKKDKVLNAIRATRGGELYNSQFGKRMEGEGKIVANIEQMFEVFSRKYGFNKTRTSLTSKNFRRPGDQLTFF